MLLTIDVGNTNMVFSVFEGETLRGSFRLTTVAGRTSDELGMDIWNQLSRLGIRPEDLADVIVSSVVPPVMAALTDALVRYLGKTPIVVDVDVDPGLPYGVVSNEHLGADRSVACVAAIHKYGAPLILADMGTAAHGYLGHTHGGVGLGKGGVNTLLQRLGVVYQRHQLAYEYVALAVHQLIAGRGQSAGALCCVQVTFCGRCLWHGIASLRRSLQKLARCTRVMCIQHLVGDSGELAARQDAQQPPAEI